MRRPFLWAGLALLILGLFIAPVFRLAGWNLGASALAADLEARRGYEILARDFAPGWMGPTAIVLEVLSGEGRLKTTAGRASFAVLLAQDLAALNLGVLACVSRLGKRSSVIVSDGQ